MKNNHPARQVVRQFFEACIAEDWEECRKYCQQSWLKMAEDGGHDSLYQLADKIEPLGVVEVIRVEEAHRVKIRKGGKVKPRATARKRGQRERRATANISSCMVDVRVRLAVTLGEDVIGKVVSTCRVIREHEGSAAPNGPGSWGVNPASIFRIKELAPAAEG